MIDNSGTEISASVYRKSTFTGVLTNYHSFTNISYKIGLVKCLLDRAFRITNNWPCFDKELKNISKILTKNSIE